MLAAFWVSQSIMSTLSSALYELLRDNVLYNTLVSVCQHENVFV